MEKIDEIDHLRMTLANSEAERAALLLERAKANQAAVHSQMQTKYAWQPGDTYDEKTLAITRAVKDPG